MYLTTHPKRGLVPAVVALGLAVPAAAQAADAPAVSTGNASKITQTTAQLNGSVNPRDVETTYVFQYGPTAKYGVTTAPVAVGKGTAAKPAAAAISGLAPFTKYHFRLVARSGAGTTNGPDKTFTTQKQPLGLTLTADPIDVPYGGATTINGTLSGTENVGKQVSLQQNVFPFTAGFATAGNPQVISDAGTFAFPILALTATTQYKVAVVDRPNVVSPIVTVAPSVTVRTHTSSKRVKRGRSVRFYGTYTPARDGAQVGVQKLNEDGEWVTVSGTAGHHDTDSTSKYSDRVKIKRGGKFRVFVALNDGDVANSFGSTVTIHSYR